MATSALTRFPRGLSSYGFCLLVALGCGGNPEVGGGVDTTMGNGGSAGSGGSKATGNTGPILDTAGETGEGGGEGGVVEAVCGNRELEVGEVCDDGNTADGDGCSAACDDVDLDFDCSVVGDDCVRVVICGDGTLQGAETCDDGNTSADDGCAADCSAAEPGYVCVRPGTPCVELPECGNLVRERGEECDDGDKDSADGCDATCQLEPNWDCPPQQSCVQRECGNSVRTPDEDCDDGDKDDADGCSSTCMIEPGFRCNSNGCQPLCGDGLKRGAEACDDGDRDSGDGCSAGCTIEPFFDCGSAQPSVCTTTIACGNSVVEPGEVCDPPGTNGCNAGCQGFVPDTAAPPVCGNNVVELGETCDPPNGNKGCAADCKVQNGYTCPQAGVCFRNPYCGDQIVQSAQGEACDPPNLGNGCTATCKEESGWTCVGLGPSTCVKPVCGNDVVEPGEQCDDGNDTSAGDGCHQCKLATGYVCPTPGAPCRTRCGDGKKLGAEQCDDGNTTDDDGCNAGCKIEPGFICPTENALCQSAVCGNMSTDSGEGCDDGGTCVGGSMAGTACSQSSTCTGGGQCRSVAGDGCGATCQPEPTVTVGPNPTVDVFCGDGLLTGIDGTGPQVCDDGNADLGDGCDDDCQTESGWVCESKTKLPTSLAMQVTYRDFKKRATTGGHPDFEWGISSNSSLPGPVCKRNNTECTELAGVTCPTDTCGHLDSEGKPVFHRANGTSNITSPETFALWYRDTNASSVAGQNGVVDMWHQQSTLVLNQLGGVTSDVYEYDDTAFWPLTGKAFGNDGNGQNFHFTTELRYFFQYQGGETLTFRGDDDVWVFVNGRHAVDIGGVHGAQWGRVILGDDGEGTATDSNCTVNRGGSLPACALETDEIASDDDLRFGLTKGEVYEIVLFQAERHTSQSNFRLTLAGFLAPRSFCEPDCGDGVIVADEYCDEGDDNSDTVSGACNSSCTARNFCGDAIQQDGEACDDGINADLYKTSMSPSTACAPGCVAPASCGDGVLQAAFEECDRGSQNNDASYGPSSCKKNCTLGGYCGDGTTNGTEACDKGSLNGTEYGAGSCGYDCLPGPSCGDGTRNGAEQCDDGDANGSALSNCASNCKIKEYCGDGIPQDGEECDYGQFASNAYGGCTATCMSGPTCGDGTPDAPYEECDDGAASSSAYGGCTDSCGLGPHCGDGELQAGEGEECDNGFNDDIYTEGDMPCAAGCVPPPKCGDGSVQAGFELCDYGDANDDDTYDGCTSSCEFGPFCGDGLIDDGDESCDDGFDNVSYSPSQGGCGYDCQPAPYCGDGTRNGTEQCDDRANDGSYGTCNDDCTLAPRCGDGVKQGPEQCDEGPAGSPSCTIACKRRNVAK